MTDKQIKKSILTERLQLNFWKRLTHYGIVFFLAIIPSLFLFLHVRDYVLGNPKPMKEGEMWFVMIPSLLGFVFFWIQHQRLKLQTIETNCSIEQLAKIIVEVGETLEWIPYRTGGNCVVFKTHTRFFTGSWGEQVTIIIDKNRLLVNSICDPDKQSSVVSFGRNRKNIRVLREKIKQACS